jgi:hypothetical protein
MPSSSFYTFSPVMLKWQPYTASVRKYVHFYTAYYAKVSLY